MSMSELNISKQLREKGAATHPEQACSLASIRRHAQVAVEGAATATAVRHRAGPDTFLPQLRLGCYK